MLEADEADLVESLLANSRRERLEQTLKDIQQTKLSLDSISNVTGITIVELGGDL